MRDLGPRYRCLRELGSGGTGTVYLVRDAHLGRELALKLLHSPVPLARLTAEAVQEIQGEFSLLSGIEHPGIARVHDFGYIAERPFFTSDYIDGAPFGGQGTAKSFDEILSRAIEVAEALAFLHRSKILHLDLKPSNILLPRGGARAVLIDFGLGRRWLPVADRDRLRGSLPYLAPECFEGKPSGPWTDVYGFAGPRSITPFAGDTLAWPRFRETGAVRSRSAGSRPRRRPARSARTFRTTSSESSYVASPSIRGSVSLRPRSFYPPSRRRRTDPQPKARHASPPSR